jgi:fatty acid desaturase
MEEHENLLGTLLERAEEYGKTTLELIKLKSVDKLAETASRLMSRIIAMVFLIMFFLWALIALSLWLGYQLGHLWLGFLIVAAFFGLVGVILQFFMHNPVKNLFANLIIKKFLK